MYFWNIEKLKQLLAERKFSDKDTFPYFFALSVLTVLATVPFFENNGWDVFNAFLSGFITLFGTWYLYRVNGGSRGVDFFARYFSIAWVVFMRQLVFVFLPVIIVWILLFVIVLSYGDSKNILFQGANFLDSVTVFFLEGIYLWMMARHMRDVTKRALKSE